MDDARMVPYSASGVNRPTGGTMNYRQAMATDPRGTLRRITGEDPDVIRHDRYRRTHYVTGRQNRLLALAASGWQGSQRELAERTGYSLSGLGHALSRLGGLFVIAVTATRGRYGRTRLALIKGWRHVARVDASSANVPPVHSIVELLSGRGVLTPRSEGDIRLGRPGLRSIADLLGGLA